MRSEQEIKMRLAALKQLPTTDGDPEKGRG